MRAPGAAGLAALLVLGLSTCSTGSPSNARFDQGRVTPAAAAPTGQSRTAAEMGPRRIKVPARADVVIGGASRDDFLGQAVADAGDVNGDGHRDVIVGAPKADPRGRRNAGVAYVIFGDGRERTEDPRRVDVRHLRGRGFRIIGEHGGGRFGGDNVGEEVFGVGDVNGDGLDDVAVDAPFLDGRRYNSGRVYVVYGRREPGTVDLRRLGRDGFRIERGRVWALTKVGTGVGDVDGDGFGDLVVLTDPKRSRRRLPADYRPATMGFVVLGRRVDRDVDLADLGRRGFRIRGRAPDLDNAARVGDVNGDGRSDYALGSTEADFKTANGEEQVGAAFVVFGRRRPGPIDLDRLGRHGYRIDGPVTSFENGVHPAFGRVQPSGDVNADGLDDIVIGSEGRSPHGRFSVGSAYVVLGRPNARNLDLAKRSPRWFAIEGSGRRRVLSVSEVGDVNGDRFADVGAHVGVAGRGSVHYVVWGNARPRTIDLRDFTRRDGVIVQAGDRREQLGELSRLARRDHNRRSSLVAGRLVIDANGRPEAPGKAWILYR